MTISDNNPFDVESYGCDCHILDGEPDLNGHLSSCNVEWRAYEEQARCRYPLPPVTCAWCGCKYMDIIGTYDAAPTVVSALMQGDNCAGAAYISSKIGCWVVECFYGSSLDMNVYRFVRNEPSEEVSPVCDACIQKRLGCGDLVYSHEAQFGHFFIESDDV